MVEHWSQRHCYSFSTRPTLEVGRTVFDSATATMRIYFTDQVAADSLGGIVVLSGLDRTPLDSRIRYNPTLSRLTLMLDPGQGSQDPILVALPATIHSLDGHLLEEGKGDEILFQTTGQTTVTDSPPTATMDKRQMR